jgi:hypothetical protein
VVATPAGLLSLHCTDDVDRQYGVRVHGFHKSFN